MTQHSPRPELSSRNADGARVAIARLARWMAPRVAGDLCLDDMPPTEIHDDDEAEQAPSGE